jgi:hypothetical protein
MTVGTSRSCHSPSLPALNLPPKTEKPRPRPVLASMLRPELRRDLGARASVGTNPGMRGDVMRIAALAIALLMSGTAVAQTTDPDTTTTDMTAPAQTVTAAPMAATGAVVQPDNTNPKRDARGIPVVSEAAVVPIGWNGVQGAAMGGPLVDPATGQTVDTASSYPPCSRTVTDKCVQTYERHRAR